MAIRRKKTLQELLSSIGAGEAPVYSGNVNSQRQATPRPSGSPIGMTTGPSMPTVDYGSGPVTELPGNLLGPGGTLDPDRFGEKVWLDPWSWHYKPVKNEGGGWRNPVLKPTMPGWEEGTYLGSGKPAMQGDPLMGQNWIQYNTTDPASPYYQPPYTGPDLTRGVPGGLPSIPPSDAS